MFWAISRESQGWVVAEPEPTARPEHAQRLIDRSAAAGKRLLHVLAPYRAHIRRICRGRVLDVGCGIGRNLAHLNGAGVGVAHVLEHLSRPRAEALLGSYFRTCARADGSC